MGPLSNTTVIELAGLGPAPMAGMMLADMGADVIRVERSTKRTPDQRTDVSFRGKKSIALNLKSEAGVEALLRLVERADALIEGYRPGVAERLGVGPDVCQARNARLVYGRMTGWGQDGPLASVPGHDINYIALSGALHAIGEAGGKPVIPLNIVGDMGGGGMLLAFGVVSAMFEAQRSGKGQVVDAAMVDGAAQLMWMQYGMAASGVWQAERRGVNMLDGGAHFYQVYETADGKYVALGAIEPQFYEALIERAGLDRAHFGKQLDVASWPQMKIELEKVFKTRTRDEWCALMEGSDACLAPVLSMTEAPHHAHNQARGTFVTIDDVVQPAPAPRFSRTTPEIRHSARPAGSDGAALLADAGYSEEEIAELVAGGALMPGTAAKS